MTNFGNQKPVRGTIFAAKIGPQIGPPGPVLGGTDFAVTGPTAVRPLLTSMLFLPSSLSQCLKPHGPRPCSASGRPTQAGLQSPQLPLYGSNMHPSSGRNPRWFSRGFHLYHPGHRQINWSSVRCSGRQNHNQTPLWKGEHSSLAWQRLYAHPQVSHSLTCTGWTHLDI